MVWSHHSHSGQFCRHAKGTLQEVLEAAVRQDFKVYGLSEHMPRFRKQDLYPEEVDLDCASLMETFAAYVEEAKRLKPLYADRLTVLLGLETESIHPGSIQELESVLEAYSDSIEYVVGSVHHVRGIPIDFDRPTFQSCLDTFQGDLQAFFQSYFEAQYEVFCAVQPEVVGHFDLCRLYCPDAAFDEQTWSLIKRNVEYVAAYGGLFEVNAAAFRKGWRTAYPAMDILQLILTLNGRLCLSDDSHGPQAVALHYPEAYQYLREQDVKTLWHLDLPRDGESCAVGRRRTIARPAKDWQIQIQAPL